MKSEKKGLKRLRSLNLTLWKNFCFMAFFIILLVGVICYVIMQSAFASLTQDKVRNVGVSVSKRLEESANGSVQSFLVMDEYIERTSFENNVNIAVLTSDGNVILPIEQRLSESEREYWAQVYESVIDRLSDFEGNAIQFVTGNVYTLSLIHI